jgi:hypothetical protein
VLDLDHVEFANTCAIDIPGPETDALGEICREYDVYVMAQERGHRPPGAAHAGARHLEAPGQPAIGPESGVQDPGLGFGWVPHPALP